MSFIASLAGGKDLLGTISGSSAADAAEAASRRQAEAIRQSMAYMMPYYNQGLQAQNKLMSLLGLSGDTQAEGYGSMARNFGMEDFQADPGYAFRMSEGLKALERSAAGRGGAASGAAMKGITRYGQDLASQEFQNAYNRYQTNRANLLNPLFNISGGGRSAAESLLGGTRDIGDAEASGIVGAANARQQAFNQLLNFGANVASAYGGRSGGGMGGGGGGSSIY
jgi:hypothetical protein